MIGRIRGEVLEKSHGVAVVDCNGVGYEISVPESVMVQMPALGSRVDLYIRQVFREDGVSLYGFMAPFERRVFDLLLEVKGCGPKVGLALLGQLGAQLVAQSVIASDARTLCKATGVGQRLADRIILEIKTKMSDEVGAYSITNAMPMAAPWIDDELISALLGLEVKKAEAEWAANQIDPWLSIQEKIKLALNLIRR